jgi:hypothetical protein
VVRSRGGREFRIRRGLPLGLPTASRISPSRVHRTEQRQWIPFARFVLPDGKGANTWCEDYHSVGRPRHPRFSSRFRPRHRPSPRLRSFGLHRSLQGTGFHCLCSGDSCSSRHWIQKAMLEFERGQLLKCETPRPFHSKSAVVIR